MYNAANYYEDLAYQLCYCAYEFRYCLWLQISLSFQKMQFYKSYLGKNVLQITTR